jgi:hypothetical protein
VEHGSRPDPNPSSDRAGDALVHVNPGQVVPLRRPRAEAQHHPRPYPEGPGQRMGRVRAADLRAPLLL